MKELICCVTLLIVGCIPSHNHLTPSDTKFIRTSEYQKEIDTLLDLDAENKRWERIYLQEIAAAQENDDILAYKFFIIEYIRIPRLIIPEWMKSEPKYVPQISAEHTLRDKFRELTRPPDMKISR